MEYFIVMLAVGASAIYLGRRFWRSISSSGQTDCAEGCGGCSCSSGGGNHLQADGSSCREHFQEPPTNHGREKGILSKR